MFCASFGLQATINILAQLDCISLTVWCRLQYGVLLHSTLHSVVNLVNRLARGLPMIGAQQPRNEIQTPDSVKEGFLTETPATRCTAYAQTAAQGED